MNFSYKIIGFMAIAALNFASCNKPTAFVKEEKFSITDSFINQLKIDTVAETQTLSDRNFSAKITADENRMTKIFPFVGGIVNQVNVQLGDYVNQGQLLATINSAEIANLDKEVTAAAATLKIAERSFHASESLYNGGLISDKEFETAKNELKIAQAEYKRATTTLKINGGGNNNLSPIKAPISGFVIDKNIHSNMQLRPDNDENIFTIADLSKVWAIINIYESDIARIETGNDVEISALSYPEKTFHGKINKIYNVLDEESKVIHAKVIIDNADFALKPGMMASVKVAVQAKIKLPVIDAACVLFDNNKNYVLVLQKDNTIKIQEVKVMHKAENKAYISSGIVPGDKVIASKQVFIYESLK